MADPVDNDDEQFFFTIVTLKMFFDYVILFCQNILLAAGFVYAATVTHDGKVIFLSYAIRIVVVVHSIIWIWHEFFVNPGNFQRMNRAKVNFSMELDFIIMLFMILMPFFMAYLCIELPALMAPIVKL